MLLVIFLIAYFVSCGEKECIVQTNTGTQLQEGFEKVMRALGKVENEVKGLSLKIDLVNSTLSKKFANLEETTKKLEETTMKNSQKLTNLEEKLTNLQHVSVLDQRDSRIAANHTVIVNNGKGCGCYFCGEYELNLSSGKKNVKGCFVITVGHNVYKKKVKKVKMKKKKKTKTKKRKRKKKEIHECTKKNLKLALYNNNQTQNLTIENIYIPQMVNKKLFHDIALVKVKEVVTFSSSLKISKQRPDLLNVQYFGKSIRKGRLRGVYGRITEEHKGDYYYKMDSGGTKGYSGTCLIHDGAVWLLHVGSAEFTEGDESSGYSDCLDIEPVEEARGIMTFCQYFGEFVRVNSRNPRTKVISSSVIFEKKIVKISDVCKK